MGPMSRQSCVLLCAILLVAAVSIQSQQANSTSAPSQQTSTAKPSGDSTIYGSATVLEATTRPLVVDVVATDGKGQAIRSLERPDFTILENGVEQQIRAFSFQEPKTSPSPSQLTPEALNAPENVFTNAP